MTESEASRRYREEMANKWDSDDDSTPEQKKEKARKASEDYKAWASPDQKALRQTSLDNARVAAQLGWEKPQQKAITITGKEDGVLIDGLVYTALYWSDGSVSYKKM